MKPQWKIDTQLQLFFPPPIVEVIKLFCAQSWEELKAQYESAHPRHGSDYSPYLWPERYKDRTGLFKDVSERMIPRFAWLYPTNIPICKKDEMEFRMLDITLHQKQRHTDIQTYGVLLLYVRAKPEKYSPNSDLIAEYQAVRTEDLDRCRQWLASACGYLFQPGSLYPFSWFGKKTLQFYKRQKRQLRKKCDFYKSRYLVS